MLVDEGNPAGYDLNGDALVDAKDVSVWIKDLSHSWIGDANLDGEFNSSDLVSVLSSGTYEADIDGANIVAASIVCVNAVLCIRCADRSSLERRSAGQAI